MTGGQRRYWARRLELRGREDPGPERDDHVEFLIGLLSDATAFVAAAMVTAAAVVLYGLWPR